MAIRIVSVAAALVLLALPSSALGYQIHHSGAGAPVRWADGAITVDLSLVAEPGGLARGRANRAVEAAFATWAGELEPWLAIEQAPAEADALPSARDGLNVVRWVTDPADDDRDPEALATALVSYQVSTGEITEVDIVVNAVDFDWAVVEGDCRAGVYDLQNVVTHEVGHFFGLSHEMERGEATMFPRAAACEVGKRDLDVDDRDGVDFLYGTMQSPGGEAPQLAGCGAAGPGGDGGGGGLVALVLVVGLSWRLRGAGRRGRFHRGIALSAALIAAASGTADADVLRGSSVAELSDRADLIVDGAVIGSEVVERGDRLFTDLTVRVASCWRGASCPDTVVVRQPGGELGDRGQWMPGTASLAVGEAAVLMLRNRGDGTRAPLGLAAGVFRRTVIGAHPVLLRDLSGVARVAGAAPLGPGIELWSAASLRAETHSTR